MHVPAKQLIQNAYEHPCLLAFVRRLLTKCFLILLTLSSIAIYLSLWAESLIDRWIIWKSSSTSSSSSSTTSSSTNDPAMMKIVSSMTPSLIFGSYIFSNRTRASHNQNHGHHHRNYRDRCHHPFLYSTISTTNAVQLIFFITLLFILIVGVYSSNLSKEELISNLQANKTSSLSMSNQIFSNITNPYVSEEIVCGNVDIRNSVEQFKQLENCTIVEGHLQIVLIDNGQTKDFENITFPKLREVTDYLLMFRVMGLQSLAKMFPNLSVIRGNKLLHNYAFVIYEMLHLQEIGLKSLTSIVRGDIRIQKNPNLCFVDTIDWSRIARNVLISDNKDQNGCPDCADNCPIVSARRNDGKSIGDSYSRVCWTSDICQKHSCSSECEALNRTCSETEHCCPEQCLGGCYADSKTQSSQICFLCKNFVYKNRCFDVCPNNSYAYYNRRCLSEDECHELSNFQGQRFKFKAFMKECDYKCPVGYTEDPNDPQNCIKCGDNCPKLCESAQISNIAQAQSLKDCTIINGSLEISISNQGALIVKEIEESLKDLVEIRGYLKIARSFPLITLNFLKNLRIIHGNSLERNSYSLLIVDNPNLQDLWTFEENEFLINNEKRIKILNGRIFVHINPKLCYQKITNLSRYMDIVNHQMPWDERDVSRHSNGDKVPCNVSKLLVKLVDISSEILLFRFENFKFKMEDPRSLLGYLIYYREANNGKNVTIFEGRDACSNNEWTVIEYDTMRDDDNITFYDHIIPNLKPYTRYALYIKTYTINTATKGAQSDIKYFKTKPDTPSQPLNLFAKAKKHNQIFVKWDPPTRPNGEVTHYNVRATKDELRIVNREHCTESITKDQVTPLVIQSEPIINHHWLNFNNITNLNNSNGNNNENGNLNIPSKLDPSKQCCSCNRNEDVVKIRPNDVEQSINFEDYLLNTVYVKRTVINSMNAEDDELRKKRYVDYDNYTTFTNESFQNETILTTHIPESVPNEKWQFDKSVSNRLDILISDLDHYSEYTIEVKACQNESNLCSVTAITSVKTLPLAGADDIDENSISYTFDNNTNNLYKTAHIKWDEPLFPNGFILSYQIEYYRVTSGPEKSLVSLCITRDHYEKNDFGHKIELYSGNYSVRLRARSLANYGNWTEMFYIFIKEPVSPTLNYVIIILVILFILTMAIPILYYKMKSNSNKLDYMSVNPDYINSGSFYQRDPKWEIAREKIRLIRELGEGSFGKVFEGEYLKEKIMIRCAVKRLNENSIPRDRINFLKEADVMKSFTDCHHVVKLLGICSKDQPFLVLMEIMSMGDLRNYLRNNRPDSGNIDPHPPTLSQIYKMSIEIADGMAYLASKRFVHRDLAARNCMLSEDLTVKIGDFGMTRDICESDYYRKGDKGFLPVRWMSPESLQDGIFTTYSDVWAYGVVLWEMVTLASQPYQGLSNEEVLKFVIEGHHMHKPENCPDVLWELMRLCWRKKPKSRPSFGKIIEILLEHVDKRAFLSVCFYNPCQEEKIDNKNELMPLNVNGNDTEFSEDDTDHQLAEDDKKFYFFPLNGIAKFKNEKYVDDDNEEMATGENDNFLTYDGTSTSYPMDALPSSTLNESNIDKNKSYFDSKNSPTIKGRPSAPLNDLKNRNVINGHLIDTSMV